MFLTRLLSGIVLIIVLAFLLITGGTVLWTGIMVISLIGMMELYRLMHMEKKDIGYVGYACALLYGGMLLFGKSGWGLAVIVLAFLLMMAEYVFSFPEYSSEEVMLCFFGLIYVPVMLFYLYKLRLLDQGYLVWLVFIASWGCDTCAYCVGMLIGRNKMAPLLSPKKSVEGAIGGVAGAVALGLIFGAAFTEQLTVLRIPVLSCALICGVGSLISMVGDLAASALKRNHNIKDYGKLIPGHGGIMDRFDSVIFVAPVIYYLVRLLSI